MHIANHRAGHVRILMDVARYVHIEEMPHIFKNPLKFSRIIPYFQFLTTSSPEFSLTQFFVDIALQMKCLIYARCMRIAPNKFASNLFLISHGTAQKMKFSIKDFFSKYNQIRSFQWICSYLLKKSLMENENA